MSFFVLTSILSSLVNTYNTDVKMNAMTNAAYSVSEYLIQDFAASSLSFEDYLYTCGSSIEPAVDLLSANIDALSLWIVDADGNIVFTCGGGLGDADDHAFRSENGRYVLPDAVLQKLMEEGSVRGQGNLSGFFRKSHCTFGVAMTEEDDTFCGAVIASTVSDGMSSLLVAMNRTVLMSTLWIMLAALVAVYFITERMVAPLRSMSRAAKSFARGQFDARVSVVGSDEVAEQIGRAHV